MDAKLTITAIDTDTWYRVAGDLFFYLEEASIYSTDFDLCEVRDGQHCQIGFSKVLHEHDACRAKEIVSKCPLPLRVDVVVVHSKEEHVEDKNTKRPQKSQRDCGCTKRNTGIKYDPKSRHAEELAGVGAGFTSVTD